MFPSDLFKIKVVETADPHTIIFQDAGKDVGRIVNIAGKSRLPFPNVLDSTMVSTFRSCPQKFYLSYVRRIAPATRNPHFNAGGAFAKGLEVARRTYWDLRTKGQPDSEAQLDASAEGLLALIKTYGDYEPTEKYRNKTWDRVGAAFASYMHTYPLGSDHLQVAEWHGSRMVEFSFALEMPVKNPETGDPILYAGRPDWIGQYDNQLYVVDEKTTKYFTTTWAAKWPLRAQLTGYAYACRAHGIPVNGVVVRGTALKLTEIEHAEAIMALPPWRLQRWYDQTVHTITQIVHCWNSGYFDYDLGDACVAYNGCEFQDLCKVQNIELWLTPEAGMFQENTWNPLAKEDEDD